MWTNRTRERASRGVVVDGRQLDRQRSVLKEGEMQKNTKLTRLGMPMTGAQQSKSKSRSSLVSMRKTASTQPESASSSPPAISPSSSASSTGSMIMPHNVKSYLISTSSRRRRTVANSDDGIDVCSNETSESTLKSDTATSIVSHVMEEESTISEKRFYKLLYGWL